MIGLSSGEVARQTFLFSPGPTPHDDWQAVADAVIAHHVGPDRVVVDRAVVERVLEQDDVHHAAEDHFREVLS